jgi:ribosomal protein S18 acetylase RimI-like enzyme
MTHKPGRYQGEGNKLRYEPAGAGDYEKFLEWTRDETDGYLGPTLELMQMTWPEFETLFHTVGQVYGIFEGGQPAGFYWIEEREPILHLHGLILRESFRGRGIGTEVLTQLEGLYRGKMDAIELGVHQSNVRARSLYERLGFETVKVLDDLGFYVMQKRLEAPVTCSETAGCRARRPSIRHQSEESKK